MKIGNVTLASPYVVAPMAGMTDTAFRRLVKRHGGCGLVVTEMVSSEGLVRGIDRTLEYAEYTDEERPVSIQIFGGDPGKMADAARIVEGMGADIVDVNMGCPVPKIAKHNAGCHLMREPEHAASVINAMAKAVKIPVTVKMRAGWNDRSRNAAELARRVQDAGAAAVTIHGRTAEQSYRGVADWDLVADVANGLSIPVLGSGDCVEPEQIIERMLYLGSRSPSDADFGSPDHGSQRLSDIDVGSRRLSDIDLGCRRPSGLRGISGVLVGRGVLRNPWILAQASDIAAGRPPRVVTLQQRGQFLLDYLELLLNERANEPEGFRHVAPGTLAPSHDDDAAPSHRRTAPSQPRTFAPSLLLASERVARGRERWVINKIRALCSWFSKGFEGGSQFRVRVNSCDSVVQLREIIDEFFMVTLAA